MGQRQSVNYHISKKFGERSYIFWWPSAGFGETCTDKIEAKMEYDRMVKDGGKYKLLEIVVSGNVAQSTTVIEEN